MRRRCFTKTAYNAVVFQKARHRKRNAVRHHFTAKRPVTVRLLSALRYRFKRTSSKGLIGPYYRRRRRGRRMFSGLFGKRRYRAERRDKLLLKRASRRFFVNRAITQRSLHTSAKALFVRRYTQRTQQIGLRALSGALTLPVPVAYGADLRATLRYSALSAITRRKYQRSTSSLFRKKVIQKGQPAFRVLATVVPSLIDKVSFKLSSSRRRVLPQLLKFVSPVMRRASGVLSSYQQK